MDQWCSRDRNLQGWDRDLVKILRRDRDFIKNFETETWSSRLETSKLVHFAEVFQKCVAMTSDLNFFQISGIFPSCFGCFLPERTTNKKSLNYWNFNKPFLCNIQSLKIWNLRDQDRDETWNLRDWDSQKWVLRPRPSLDTPSLLWTHYWLRCLNKFKENSKWQSGSLPKKWGAHVPPPLLTNEKRGNDDKFRIWA